MGTGKYLVWRTENNSKQTLTAVYGTEQNCSFHQVLNPQPPVVLSNDTYEDYHYL